MQGRITPLDHGKYDWMKTNDIAALFHISRSIVAYWKKQGRVQAIGRGTVKLLSVRQAALTLVSAGHRFSLRGQIYKRCSKCARILKIESYPPSVMQPGPGECSRCNLGRSAQYDVGHPEQHRLRQNRWKARNPDKVRALCRRGRSKRRAIEKGAKVGAESVFPYISQSAPRHCYWCKGLIRGKHHFDHVMPLTLGGKHANFNIVLSCPKCNRKKSNQHPNESGLKPQLEIIYV